MPNPECVILIGIPATGKSTFCKEQVFRTHLRINLDMLQTRQKEHSILDTCIANGISFVIDNTNPTIADRKRYLDSADGFTKTAYYFLPDTDVSIDRNNKRPAIEQIPISAIVKIYDKLEVPTYAEGFDKIYYINTDNGFKIELMSNA